MRPHEPIGPITITGHVDAYSEGIVTIILDPWGQNVLKDIGMGWVPADGDEVTVSFHARKEVLSPRVRHELEMAKTHILMGDYQAAGARIVRLFDSTR